MLFTIYKKITSPEASPVLGPAKSPDIKPMNTPDPDTNPPMESFALCDCCSQRSKDPIANANANTIVQSTKSEYEFNHATHYKYNTTTPRLTWHEFYDTGTPP
jgi:hypothetical protein